MTTRLLTTAGPAAPQIQFFQEVFVSRNLLPAEVLSHPENTGLVTLAEPTGTVTPEQVRKAAEAAAIEPKHLKALMLLLAAEGITVVMNADDHKAVAATTPRKTTTAKTAAAKKAAPAKKSAAAPAAEASPAK
jgi:RNA polymerase primary sigma factor